MEPNDLNPDATPEERVEVDAANDQKEGPPEEQTPSTAESDALSAGSPPITKEPAPDQVPAGEVDPPLDEPNLWPWLIGADRAMRSAAARAVDIAMEQAYQEESPPATLGAFDRWMQRVAGIAAAAASAAVDSQYDVYRKDNPPPIAGSGGGDPGGETGGLMMGSQVALERSFSSSLRFANLMHHSDEWKPTNTAERRLSAVDEAGNPLEDSYSTLRGAKITGLAGAYDVSHVGGTVEFDGSGVDSFTGSTLVLHDEGQVRVIVSGDVRSLKVLRQGVTGYFLPEAVEKARALKLGVWRSMHSLHTTYAGYASAKELQEAGSAEAFFAGSNWRWDPLWERRTLTSHTRWSCKTGVPLEVEAEWCKAIGVHTWMLSLPVSGSDERDGEYAQRAAELVAAVWDKTVAVEPSDEAWNDDFPIHRLSRDRAATVEEGFAAIADTVFAGFRNGWPEDREDDLLLCVFGHTIRPEFLTQVLSHLKHTPNVVGCSYYVPLDLDALRALGDQAGAVSVDTLLQMWRDGMPTLLGKLQAHRKIADDLGALLFLYEGALAGILGNLGRIPGLPERVIDALQDVDAEGVYRELYQVLLGVGVDCAIAFAFMDSPSPQLRTGWWPQYESIAEAGAHATVAAATASEIPVP